MRIITFLLVFSFLLLGGKECSYASENQGQKSCDSVQNFLKKARIKIVNENHSLPLIEDSDVDVEEECHPPVGDRELNKGSFFVGKYSLLHTLYYSTSKKLTLNCCCNRIKTIPFIIGSSCPLYLTIRFLRI